MVHCMDEGLGNVTRLLQSEGMWSTDEPTIIVFTDENGAPTDACAQIGGNNLPHRGGKCSIWEGGTKGVSIVASPLLTKTNITYHGLAHAVRERILGRHFVLISKGKPEHLPRQARDKY